VHHRFEQGVREVVGLGLDVLRQGQGHRPALGRIGQHPSDLRQRGQQLLWPGDPVEVAADRAERVVDRRGRVVEVLDLLEHRVGRAADERVAGQQEQREAVRVGDTGRGHHVQRAGTDGGRGDADLAAVRRLADADGGQRHPLLVVPAPDRQLLAHLFERVAEPEHVAVPEDREHAGEQRGLGAVEQLGALGEHPADERLCRGELHAVRPFAVVTGQRGSSSWSAQLSRIQVWAGSSQNASERSAPGPARTFR
jgi:hypothetical protein